MATTDAGDKSSHDPDVQHSKEDSLDAREFEELLAATYRLDDYWALQCRFVVLVAGRLGMRAGEIAHLTEDWVDWRRNMIVVPRHEPCTNGRDGGICGHCWEAAASKVAHNEGLGPERALARCWEPKTRAAAREIPFDADTRSMICIEQFFEKYDKYPHSRVSVNRRVRRAAEEAAGLEPGDVYPHALRATAAEHFVAAGLDIWSLKAVMGWATLQTAHVYVSDSGERTAAALRDIK